MSFSSMNRFAQRIEPEIHDIVPERPADQELHRKVVDALRVLAVVGLLGLAPALREDVPYRAGDRLIALPRADLPGIDDIVEHEMPLVESVARPGQLDRTAAVLPDEVLSVGSLAYASPLPDWPCHDLRWRSPVNEREFLPRSPAPQTLSASVELRPFVAGARPHCHPLISGMSSPCRAMYCLCSMSLSRIACLA